MLGLREVRALILALGMQGLAARRPLPPGFVLPRYLEHQFAVALVAMALARKTRTMDADDAFTAGVLHDLGKLITALYRPDDWLAQAEAVARDGLSWHEAEARHFGLDHGLIGAMVLHAWNLPEILTEPVNWHHAPEAAPAPQGPGYTLCCADACVHVGAGDQNMAAVLESAAVALGLTAEAALTAAKGALADRNPALLTAALA